MKLKYVQNNWEVNGIKLLDCSGGNTQPTKTQLASHYYYWRLLLTIPLTKQCNADMQNEIKFYSLFYPIYLTIHLSIHTHTHTHTHTPQLGADLSWVAICFTAC